MAKNSNMQSLFKKYEVKNAYVFAIINDEFEDRRFMKRIRADVDLKNVKKLIEEFGFDSDIKMDLTHKEMLVEFNNMKEPKFNDNDAFICFISSHGKGEYYKDSRGNHRQRDGVYGIDGEIVYLDDLVDILAKNESLKGKPIIIIAQHSRGKEITLENASAEAMKWSIRTTPISIPSHRNVLVAYSTLFNAVSYLNSVRGSWFIHYFTEALLHHDENMSLIDILSEVHNHVARRSFSHEDGLKQMPCFSHSLTMSVFFKKLIKGTEVSLPRGVSTSKTQKSDEAPNHNATENEENEYVPKTVVGDDKHVSKIEVGDNKYIPKTKRLIKKAFVFIIINEFSYKKKREGAQVDLRNILQVCETFGFEKHVEKNLSRDEMEQKVLEKIEKDDFGKYDALIVFISSYGEHNDVIGVCGQKISLDDFAKSMTRNPTLNNSTKNKPKLIFSENSNYSVVETDHVSYVPLPMHADVPLPMHSDVPLPMYVGVPLPMYAGVPLPMHADVLVAHSNLLTDKTYHDSVFGSWFMHWLTTFLKDFGDKMSLTDILTMVNDRVANVDVKGTNQAPCFSSSLRMALRFQRAVLSEYASLYEDQINN